MKKRWYLPVLLTSVILPGCLHGLGIHPFNDYRDGQQSVHEIRQPVSQGTQQFDQVDKEKKAVASLVENFGKKLQLVSLVASEDLVRESIKEHYSEFVTPALLEAWLNNPQQAPGRLVSSPWPDRIEVRDVEKKADDVYRVKGEIIEITSVEQQQGGYAAKRPIILYVQKTGNRWLIDAVELGAYEEGRADTVEYENREYGFRFVLPSGWKGYTIVTDKWEGLTLKESQSNKTVASGPLISIRHPKWTEENPRQDIPIMVFTLDQWNQLNQGKFHIGAAPVGPRELGRNTRYVFALPARYNFEFLPGYEEVEEILDGNALELIPFENSR